MNPVSTCRFLLSDSGGDGDSEARGLTDTSGARAGTAEPALLQGMVLAATDLPQRYRPVLPISSSGTRLVNCDDVDGFVTGFRDARGLGNETGEDDADTDDDDDKI